MSTAPFGELERILRLLKKLGLPHALIGGWAVITWGFLRASDDLDLVIDLPGFRCQELLDALAIDYKAEWKEGGLDDPIPGLIRADPRQEGGFPVDFLVARSRADLAAIARAVEVTAEGVTIPVVRPEDLIAMKLEAGGGQDYEDVRRLISIMAEKLDEDLLKEACSARHVNDRLALLRK